MAIPPISPIPGPTDAPGAIGATPGSIAPKADPSKVSGSTEFTDVLQNLLENVNQAQKSAETAGTDFLAGKNSVHETMILLEKADLSFRVMMEIRNKLLDAYKEISRMQV